MADIKDTVSKLINLENKITQEDGKVANFAYTDEAYNNDIIAGAASYDYSKEQNIPIGNASTLDSNITTLTKGYRTMGSSIARQIMNHFFGRCSYNLNKIHDWFKEFLIAYNESIVKSLMYWDTATKYLEGDYCFTYLNKHLRFYRAVKENQGQQPGIQNGSIWELMNASWDLRETGNTLPTSGNTSMNQLIWPATYKNLRLTGVSEIPDEITEIERDGSNSYSTVIIERGPGFVKQYIHYVNPEVSGGDQSGHYLTIRGGLLADDGQSVTNWTQWEFRTTNANHADKASDSDSLGTLKATTWDAQVKGVKVTNAINADKLGSLEAGRWEAQVKGVKVTNATNADNATKADNLNNVAKIAVTGNEDTSVQNKVSVRTLFAEDFKKRITLTGNTLTINLD